MNIALILFTLGILMITSGYTNQLAPKCNQDVKVRVIPRQVYDEILNSHANVEGVYHDML
jgi:hypothetical protein